MAEQGSFVPISELSPALDEAWRVAHAANAAHSAITEAKGDVHKTLEFEGLYLPGVIIPQEAYAVLADRLKAAEANFDLLTTMAAVVMNMPDSPFDVSTDTAAEEPTMSEILGPLYDLPLEYRTKIVDSFDAMKRVVSRNISDGTLPESLRLITADELENTLIALQPSYEAMEQKGWEPEIVFVPTGLSFEVWEKLLTGHLLSNGSPSKGVKRNWRNDPYVPHGDRGAKEAPDILGWDVAVVSALDHPALHGVGPDGTGPNQDHAQEAITKLLSLPDSVKEVSARETVRQFLPSQAEYFALQLGRLARGMEPVDRDQLTIGKEVVTLDGDLGSLYFGWFGNDAMVSTHMHEDDYIYNNHPNLLGIRPTVRGRDVLGDDIITTS